MTTAQVMITDAYIEAMVVDPVDGPDATQSNLALRFLNRIISRLSVHDVLIPYSTSESFTVSAGTGSYTMGSAGTASSARAIKIKSAYVRDSDSLDQPVGIISEQDYGKVNDKAYRGTPKGLFYDPVYPTGTIYLTPVPDATYTMHIESEKYLHSALSLGTTVLLPGEYEDALILSLATKLSRMNGTGLDGSLIQDATNAWKGIASNNLSQRIPVVTNLPFARSHSSAGLFESATSSGAFDFNLDFILS